MQWVRAAMVALVAVAAALDGVGASSRSWLVDQGYEDVVVGISPQLSETQADDIVSALKETLNEASQALFRATGNRLFFKRVKILVPSTWTSVHVDQPATNETFENSDVRVDVSSSVYGDQVYTVQPGGCGDPGRYIHVTPTYLTAAETDLGNSSARGKVLAQEWARLRWGVFDEVGFPEDQLFPLFYRAWNDEQELAVKPNHCADEEIVGSYVDVLTQESCLYVDGLPDENCRFVPDEKQTATSSLMSFTDLENIEEFCEDEGAEVRRHNAEAPNRHNLMCEGRSVWAVMADHHDFLNTSPLPANYSVGPEVVVVKEGAATFALVLDHSSYMIGSGKVPIMQNTAKMWLKHDVADGSFVTIINYGSDGVVRKSLTEVANDTRQELADSIDNEDLGGSCISCGLKVALEEMKDQNKKIILVLTSYKETNGSIKEMMPDVVESGARVVTIAYGTLAENSLEILAQNTGGKTYFVSDADDGSLMEDAFQGSLTYQPGQSLQNTNVKIYEWVGQVQEAVINGTFFVDSSVGRNLEFRLRTSYGLPSPPVLITPGGEEVTEAVTDEYLNIINVKEAESGTWYWKTKESSTTSFKATVTAQARDPEILPIYTESWVSTGVDFVDASQQTVIVYARVTQGENPVVGAKVRAYITIPTSTTVEAVELDLLDNGKNADVQAGDGIYSRYFTQFVTTGRYAVKAQVWDESSSYINNGFITSRRKSRRALPVPLALSRLSSYDQLVVPEYCCGSVVPFNPETATPTGEFTRTVAAGSFNVVAMPEGGDSFPPARVMDLSTHTNGTSFLTLRWTAPGDDYDAGTVSGYEIWISTNAADLKGNFIDENTVLLLDSEDSQNMTELLLEAGMEVTVKFNLEKPLEKNILYFVALKAVDDEGNWSPVSYPVGLYSLSDDDDDDGSDGGLEGWVIALIVICCLLVVALIGGVGFFAYKKRKKSKISKAGSSAVWKLGQQSKSSVALSVETGSSRKSASEDGEVVPGWSAVWKLGQQSEAPVALSVETDSSRESASEDGEVVPGA